MNGKKLRLKRVAAEITGHAVCQRARIPRSRLSDIENAHVTATPDEIQRIEAAIDDIIATRAQVESMAAAAGLSLAGVL